MEIIVSHNNTDFDGLASMIAAKKIYPEAQLVYAGQLNRNVREFMALHKDTFSFLLVKDIPLEEVTKLIIVDTKSPGRIGELRSVMERSGREIHIYDHHPLTPEDIKGDYEVIEQVGAATTLMVEIMRKSELKLNPFEATVFALGIYEDTGSLIFPSTTPRDAEAVAFLLAKGANLAVVQDFIDRPLSDAQKNLLNTLIVSSETLDISGVKVLIARCSTEEYIGGLALLVHKLIEIENIDVAIAIVLMDDRVHLVGRSKGKVVDVAQILARYHGGGHAAAASAIVRDGKVDTITEEIKASLKDYVRPEVMAEDIMTGPVKMVPLNKTIEEAAKILLRYGHTGLPVVEGDTLVGIISRRDIEKARHHGLGHAPVKGFMSRKVFTISRTTPVKEIQDLMIDHNIGRLPVMENGRIIGIVSRTDVLRTVHGENYPGRYERVYNITQPITCVGDNLTEVMLSSLSTGLRELLGKISFLADRESLAVFAVGGFVRDLILGVENLDIDLVVEGDGLYFARRLAEFLCGRVRVHEKFGTAMVILPDGLRIDVATARTEYYEYPAALPTVEQSSLKQDLYRRDFTINAMAIILSANNFGGVVDYFGGRRDLEAGIIRVLYNLSFVEDPTRILRAIRFEQRYNFVIEAQTLALAKNAIKSQMLSKLSIDRVREELKHILSESAAGSAVQRMQEMNMWQFILPEASINKESLEIIGRLPMAENLIKEFRENKEISWVVYLAVLVHGVGCDAIQLAERFRLTKEELKKLKEILCLYPMALERLAAPKPLKMSEIATVLRQFSDEGFAYILASTTKNAAIQERVKNYLARLKYNKLSITGEDIKKMGYSSGPLFKSAIEAARDAKLDGVINSRAEELAFVNNYIKVSMEQKGV